MSVFEKVSRSTSPELERCRRALVEGIIVCRDCKHYQGLPVACPEAKRLVESLSSVESGKVAPSPEKETAPLKEPVKEPEKPKKVPTKRVKDLGPQEYSMGGVKRTKFGSKNQG